MESLDIFFKKHNLIKYCIAITLIFILFFLTACNLNEKDEEIETKSFINYDAAVFEKNNNIYVYYDDDQYLTGIGDLSKFKEFTALSNDKNYIAFKYRDINDSIEIYDLNTGKYSTLKIDKLDNENITNMSWKDNKLVVELYVNPTTTKNLIYDVNENKLINSCEGILIDIMDEGQTLIYAKNYKGDTAIYINTDKVFELENAGEVLIKGALDKENQKINFITFYFDRESGEQKEFLYEGVVEENKFTNVKKVNKPFEIGGEIVYYNGLTGIVGANSIYLYEDDKFTKIQDEDNTFDENLNKLKLILKNTFKSETLSEGLTLEQMGIFNITWFSR